MPELIKRMAETKDGHSMKRPTSTSALHQALASFPTGVCVVTGLDTEGRPHAFVTSQFMSASQDTPLIAMVPPTGSAAWDVISATGRFCVNVLAADQEPVSRRLASASPSELLRLLSPRGEVGETDAPPVLDGAVAHIGCSIHQVLDVGDRHMVVGDVLWVGLGETVPLVACRGGYGRFAATSLVASGGQDLLEPLGVIDSARAEMEAAAVELGGRVVAQTLVDGQIVFLASAGSLPGHSSAPAMLIGSRLPAVAPVASLFMAWETQDVVEPWLRRLTSDVRRTEARTRLVQVRERGYSVGLGDRRGSRLFQELVELGFPTFDQLSREQVMAIEDIAVDPLDFGADQVTEVEWLAVPVFGSDRRVCLVLGLEGVPAPSGWAEFERRLARLEQAASNTMTNTGGKVAVS